MMEKQLKFALNTFFWWSIVTMYIWAARDFGSLPAYFALLLRLILQVISFALIFKNDIKVKRGFTYKLVLVWMIYTTVITLINPHAPRELSENLWWPCMFILFYHIAAYPRLVHDLINNKLKKMFIASFIMFVFTYTAFSFGEMHATNYVFFISMLFPFLFFLKDKDRYLYFIIGLILSILAFKRSGMLVAASAGLAICWYDFFKAKGKRRGEKKIIAIFFILAVIGVYVIIDNYTGGHMSERFSSIEEDGGSGRDIIFEYVIAMFGKQNFTERFFGIGFNGVMHHQWFQLGPDVYISAHNDFLEVICDFGYVGSLLYLLFIINIIKNTKQIRKLSGNMYKANITSLVIFFITSMVSHLFLYPTYFAFIIMLWSITSHYVVNKNIHRIV